MSTPRRRSRRGRRLGRGLAPALVVVALAAGSAALAAPAAAQTTGAVRPVRPAVCARAQRQWARLVRANAKTKTAFTRAQALQNTLLRAGRVGLAHRLDARLTYLRSLHVAFVDRVAAIESRIEGRCSASPPQLVSF